MKGIDLIIFFVASLFMVNCSPDDDGTTQKIDNARLQDCKNKYLFFNDDIRPSRTNLGSPNLAYPNLDSIVFNYENENLTKVIGGYAPIPGVFAYDVIFSDAVYDSIVKFNNTYEVYTKPWNLDAFENSEKPIQYEISDNHIKKITNRSGTEYNYIYEGDNILEKTTTRHGVEYVRRKFHFINGNLVKVEFFTPKSLFDPVNNTILTNPEFYVYKKIFFIGYDASPNIFKGQYYVLGAFYRSFSENNYFGYIVNEYFYSESIGITILDSTYEASATFGYNVNNYPLFGNYK